MIAPEAGLSISRQCTLLGVARRRHLRQPGSARRNSRQARLCLRRHGRTTPREYRPPDAGVRGEYRSAGVSPACAHGSSPWAEGPWNGSDRTDDRASSLALPDKPSIAVLPFQNMSGDPEQEYFADGMVEEIIAAISRAFWISRLCRKFKGLRG